jgi:hypothetical protein
MLKASFLRDCDPGLALIETLRLENGQYPRLAGHLARLRSSPAGWVFRLMSRCSTGCLTEPLARRLVAGSPDTQQERRNWYARRAAAIFAGRTGRAVW